MPKAIRKKINKAFCPEGEVEFNPVLDWVRSLILRDDASPWTIHRDEKWGGDMHFENRADLEAKFAAGEVHPGDLKNEVANHLIELLTPVREELEAEFDLETLWRQVKITR